MCNKLDIVCFVEKVKLYCALVFGYICVIFKFGLNVFEVLQEGKKGWWVIGTSGSSPLF